MKWLARLFPPRRHEPGSEARAVAAPDAATPSVAAAVEAAALLPWLLGCAASAETGLSAAEQRALDAVDRILSAPALPDDLLPRAAALIPQLLALLRQSELPVPVLAQRIAKDVVLAAEVLRLASSAFYRAQGEVTDLAQAIALIGVDGLQTVVARVVMKPMYDPVPGLLSARATPRLWQHAEALAHGTASLAAEAGEPGFDGYLAGLLYDSGWTMLLRALDQAGIALPLPPSAAFAGAAALRAHRLFGRAAPRWTITPGFTAFGADARRTALADSTQPLAVALRQALPHALAEVTQA